MSDDLTPKEKKVAIVLLVSCLLLVLMLVSGCSAASLISQKGAEGSDEVLRDSIWVMCNATPVGAVKRKFNTPELVDAYNTICSSQAKLPVP